MCPVLTANAYFFRSVCLVLEICEYGSLSDVLRGGDGTAGQSRPPLNLSYSDRMFLALGCARGLQALHAYSPLLCHRDIKSMNFLSECTAAMLLLLSRTQTNVVVACVSPVCVRTNNQSTRS
jgi:serine/threonine protein kinase